MYSSNSSTFARSQPATPIHSVQPASQSFKHTWDQGGALDAEMTAALAAHSRSTQPTEMHDTFDQQLRLMATDYHGLLVQNDSSHVYNPDAFCNLPLRPGPSMSGAWSHPQEVTDTYAAHSTCLGPALFSTSHGLRLDTNTPASNSVHNNSPIRNFGSGLDTASMGHLQNYATPSSAEYQCPRLVVPSQLSPDDAYVQHHLGDYTTPDHSNDGLSSSFASSTAFDSFELMDAPSPMQDYFDQADQDYIMVKDESMNDSEYYDSAQGSVGYNTSRAPSVKRRSSRRARSDRKRPWHKHTVGQVEVCCEGTRFDFDGTVRIQSHSSSKKFVCKHVEASGESCRRAFDRSEHLKRHMGMHSKERPFPCPLPGCKQRIQRSDNAVQHFQTHIRVSKPGKRNPHFDWSTVHLAILENYEDQKRAKKLLDNLQKWIDNGMPETTSTRKQ